ncbi:MAG: iron uptake porin, partial [Cyanobacteriota bacterium]
MTPFQRLLLAPAALGLLAPTAASAAELNLADLNQYAGKTGAEQVTSINQFSDVRPTDWAYQALNNLIERYGCVAGYPNGTFKGGQAMTRYEAAALLNACLDRVTEVTDELKRLMAEFEKELAVLRGRVDGLEARVGELEANQFSTTTRLRADTRWVMGGLSYSGNQVNDDNTYGSGKQPVLPLRDAFTFNYDVRLNFDTSFSGKDLLKTQLRAGNF